MLKCRVVETESMNSSKREISTYVALHSKLRTRKDDQHEGFTFIWPPSPTPPAMNNFTATSDVLFDQEDFITGSRTPLKPMPFANVICF